MSEEKESSDEPPRQPPVVMRMETKEALHTYNAGTEGMDEALAHNAEIQAREAEKRAAEESDD